VDIVARQYGGRSAAVADGASIHVSSPEWTRLGLPHEPFVVAAHPKSNDDWKYRLRIAEQMSARASLSRPYVYFGTLEGKGATTNATERVQVLRCAFGLALVSGPLKLWRMTAYHIHPWNLMHVIEGNDELFSLSQLNLRSAKFHSLESFARRIEDLCLFVNRASEEFPKRSDIQEALLAHKDRLAAEIAMLDSLYFDQQYQRGLLHGLPSGPLTGDGAIEVEYRKCLEELVQRFAVRVQVRLLSLGVLMCKGKRSQRGRDSDISLPFVSLRGARRIDNG